MIFFFSSYLALTLRAVINDISFTHIFFSFFTDFLLISLSRQKQKSLLKSNIYLLSAFYCIWVRLEKTHNDKLLVLPYKPDFFKVNLVFTFLNSFASTSFPSSST